MGRGLGEAGLGRLARSRTARASRRGTISRRVSLSIREDAGPRRGELEGAAMERNLVEELVANVRVAYPRRARFDAGGQVVDSRARGGVIAGAVERLGEDQ